MTVRVSKAIQGRWQEFVSEQSLSAEVVEYQQQIQALWQQSSYC